MVRIMLHRLVLIWLSVMFAGCTAMMVGGAGVAGYQLGKDERPPATVAADSTITTKIKGKFAGDAVVSVFDVGVSTYEGRVTLTGDVGSYAARETAEKIALETGGVKSVNNQIRIEN